MMMICGAVGAGEMDGKFEAIGEAYLEDLLRASPVAATGMGDHRYDHVLDEVDGAARESRVAALRGFVERLDGIAVGDLSRENQVDYHLVKQRVEKEIWEIEELREWAWNPLGYSALAGSSIYGLLAREPEDLEGALMAAAARLREFPRLFAQAREALVPNTVPWVHAETALDQTRGLNGLLDGELVPRLGECSEAGRAAVEGAIAVARVAIAEHVGWIEEELVTKAEGEPRMGAERYAEKLRWVLFSPVTPEALRAQAEERLEELHGQMYRIALEVAGERDLGVAISENPTAEQRRELIVACLELAAEDRPGRGGVVEAAEHSLALTTDFVRAKDLVTIPEDPLEIIVMPEFRRGVSLAYCDAPGPLDAGEKTFYAVAPPPQDWTDAQVESHLREYNHRSLHVLTVHEALPGHFLQLAHANRGGGRLRSVLASGSFIEGWATYTEWMMCEEGFLAEDPLMRLVTLKWYLRDVGNTLIDQMVHIDGVEEMEAVRFLREEAFQEKSEAVKKYRRTLLTSGQLATYFTGYLELVDLRHAVEEARGETFDLKEYHDEVISFGSPPTRYVKALMLGTEIPK